VRLLAIEDNPGDLRLLRELLLEVEPDRIRLESAGTLAEGIAMADGGTFDAALLDLSLPDSHGVETIATFRHAAPQLPTVVMTSLSDPSIAELAVTEGAQDYLVKGDDSGRVVMRVVRYAIERHRWQEAFADARKSEAVARLAGALAHEYNNVLTPMLGYCDLLQSAFQHEADSAELLKEIRIASERAAVLTSQLLALGGHKRIRLARLHLNEAVRRADPRLCEIVGARATFTVRLGGADDAIRFEGGELDLLLDVLMLTALESMEAGGAIALETDARTLDAANARRLGLAPGRHVLLRVHYPGTHPSPGELALLIEPFAKTRRRDTKTTGLSLASINGTLRANGAQLVADAEAGRDSTLTVYFPHASAETSHLPAGFVEP